MLQTAFTLSSVASARLGVAPRRTGIRDLGEAREAIDVLAALLPLLQAGSSPTGRELRQTLAGLQMAYGQVAQESGGAPPPPPPPPRQQQAQPPPQPEPRGQAEDLDAARRRLSTPRPRLAGARV